MKNPFNTRETLVFKISFQLFEGSLGFLHPLNQTWNRCLYCKHSHIVMCSQAASKLFFQQDAFMPHLNRRAFHARRSRYCHLFP